MAKALHKTAVSAVFAFVTGVVLWPPGQVYWTVLADVVGEGTTLALVAGLAVAAGAGFARTVAVEVRHVAAGGAVAYVVGMLAVRVVVAPDSPVHLALYAALFVCLVVGAALSTRWRGRDAR